MAVGSWLPATRKEESLWLLERLVPDEGVNNVPGLAVRVAGPVDRVALRQALRLLVDRYDVLRTVFQPHDLRLMKRIVAPGESDVILVGADCPPERTEQALQDLVTRPFPLDGSPLLRVGLFSGTDHDLIGVAVHHLIFDGASMSVFIEDLASLYEAVRSGAEPAAMDVVPAWPESKPTEKSLAYWRDQLKGLDASDSQLWCGREESAQPTLRGEHLFHTFSPEAADIVAHLQKKLRAPDVVVLLAAYFLLLHLHGGGPDLSVGFPVNIRDQQAHRAIGYHVNIVPLRVRFDRALTFRTLTRRVRDLVFEAVAHADIPMDMLLPEVDRVRGSWRTTMFRHVFNYVPFAGGSDGGFTFGGLPAEIVEIDSGHSKFDLEFVIMPSAAGFRLKVIHGTEVHDSSTARLLAERYDALLVAVAGAPDQPITQFDGWCRRDHEILWAAGTDTRSDPGSPPITAIAAVAGRVRQDPEAPALIDGPDLVTRDELWRAATAVAATVAQAGVRAGETVAVLAPRGADLAAGVLGTWLAGATALPVDPGLDAERVAAALASARLVLGATDERANPRRRPIPSGSDAAGLVPDPGLAPDPGLVPAGLRAGPGDLTQQGLAATITALAREFDVGVGPVAWLSSPSSEAAVGELLLGLLAGDGVVVVGDRARSDGRLLAKVLDHYGVRTVHATATTWARLIDDLSDALRDRIVLVSGAAVPGPLAQVLSATSDRVFAVLGPPQTAGWAFAHRLAADEQAGPPIRAPLAGKASIHAPDGRALPVGVRGEVRLSGPQFTGGVSVTGINGQWSSDGLMHLHGAIDQEIGMFDAAADPLAAVVTGPAVDSEARERAFALVVALFEELLNRPDIAGDTNFFNHGGHSLLAAQLAQRIERETGTRLKLAVIFARPTPEQLSELIFDTVATGS